MAVAQSTVKLPVSSTFPDSSSCVMIWFPSAPEMRKDAPSAAGMRTYSRPCASRTTSVPLSAPWTVTVSSGLTFGPSVSIPSMAIS